MTNISSTAALSARRPSSSPARAALLLAAGARMRCPRCGQGGLFAHALTLRMHRACPVCSWEFEREEGYWTGAVAIDMVLTELLVSVIALGLVLLTSTPALVVLAVGLPAAILFPILCYPFAKSFWMRFDLLTNPPEREAAPAHTASSAVVSPASRP